MYNILKKVYENQRLYGYLSLLSHFIVILTVLSYVPLLIGSWLVSPISSLKVIIITAAPLLLVTLLRSLVNAPRPYELYDIYEHAPKRKGGHSFPSRHACSIFAIGTVSLFIYPIMGVILLLLGLILCAARVLVGIHFIRDVAAGALSGAVCGIIGVYITNPFAIF